mgnify:CR=1 FL=1
MFGKFFTEKFQVEMNLCLSECESVGVRFQNFSIDAHNWKMAWTAPKSDRCEKVGPD